MISSVSTSTTRIAASAILFATLGIGASACTDDTDSQSNDTSTTSITLSTTETTIPLDTATTLAPTVFSVVVQGGKVQPAASRHRVALGNSVSIEVSSDVAEEIHVHGYNKSVDLQAGISNHVTFVADTPGVFEVELEKSGRKLLELEVR